MTRAELAGRGDAAPAWPWLIGGGVLAGGALLWWRRAQAAPADAPLAAPAASDAAAAASEVAGPVATAPVPSSSPPASVAPSAPVPPPVSAPFPPRTAADVLASLPLMTPGLVATVVGAAAGGGGTAPPPGTDSLPGPPPRAESPVKPPAAALPSPPHAAVAPAPLPAGTWVWPITRWRTYAPVVSDGFGSPRDGGARVHHGADLMYRRRHPDDLTATYPPRAPHAKLHFMPAGTLVLAAADGVIESAGRTARGLAITLRHAGGWVTFYQHLASLFVPALDHGTGGIRVVAGQALGIVGANPMEGDHGIAHLHFELRQGRHPVDPAPYLRGWRVLDAATVLPEVTAVVTPPAPLRDPREAAMLARIYAEHGRGLPVAYLAALGRAESGGNARDPRGVLNLTKIALDAYNQANPGTPIGAGQLANPIAAVTVASWVLREVIASYATHHPATVNLREDWTNREFVALVTAGWNAGHSETRGVGRVASYLEAHHLPVTLDNVFRFARQANAHPTLLNAAKRRFAARVTEDYLAHREGS